MFTGHYINTIDDKGRISIPSQFRQAISNQEINSLIVTKHFDGCLYGYTLDSWQDILSKVATLPQSKKEVKAYQRFVISSAVECVFDKLGRILIPAKQREYAQISKEVMFAGVGTRIEIWSREVWDKVIEDSKNILKNSEILADLGL